ncbi:MAG: PTS sugar transporter subunit IIA [Firmicutes bacterium]|jgi:PTS system galactitol-specific IIA component|nr:PTS sugar transporter subunit IIA [Bacillota bacterium]
MDRGNEPAATVAFDEGLVLAGGRFGTKEEAIGCLAGLLRDRGYVKDSFLEAVLAREREYPTGLPTRPVAVAIPHADPGHCIVPCLAVARLIEPVAFGNMGAESGVVDVSLVFLIGLTAGGDHVSFLGRLAGVFRREDEIERLMKATSAAEIERIIRSATGM